MSFDLLLHTEPDGCARSKISYSCIVMALGVKVQSLKAARGWMFHARAIATAILIWESIGQAHALAHTRSSSMEIHMALSVTLFMFSFATSFMLRGFVAPVVEWRRMPCVVKRIQVVGLASVSGVRTLCFTVWWASHAFF